MQHLIVFNAPKRSGKSYARNIVSEILGGIDCAFSDILYDSVPALYGIDKNTFMEWCTVDKDGNDEKDIPKDELFGQTPREALIDISENYLKPKFGRDCIAKITANRVKNEPVIIMDSGFVDELTPFIEALNIPTKNVYLIHIDRPNHTWDGDSRHTIHPWGDMNHIVINNDKGIKEFRDMVRDISIEILRDIQMENNIECLLVDIERGFDYIKDQAVWDEDVVSIDMNTGERLVNQFAIDIRGIFYNHIQLYRDHLRCDITNTTSSYKAIYEKGMTVKEWCDIHSSMGTM